MQRTSIHNVDGDFAVFAEVGRHNFLVMAGLTAEGAGWVAEQIDRVDGDQHDVKQAIRHIRMTLPAEFDAIFQSLL